MSRTLRFEVVKGRATVGRAEAVPLAERLPRTRQLAQTPSSSNRLLLLRFLILDKSGNFVLCHLTSGLTAAGRLICRWIRTVSCCLGDEAELFSVGERIELSVSLAGAVYVLALHPRVLDPSWIDFKVDDERQDLAYAAHKVSRMGQDRAARRVELESGTRFKRN